MINQLCFNFKIIAYYYFYRKQSFDKVFIIVLEVISHKIFICVDCVFPIGMHKPDLTSTRVYEPDTERPPIFK